MSAVNASIMWKVRSRMKSIIVYKDGILVTNTVFAKHIMEDPDMRYYYEDDLITEIRINFILEQLHLSEELIQNSYWLISSMKRTGRLN